MTVAEKTRLITKSFEDLWRDLYSDWFKFHNPDYERAKALYQSLLRSGELQKVCDNTKSIDLEWGIPKGRKKKIDEPEIVCAMREYREETRNMSYLHILDNSPTFIDENVTDSGVYVTKFFLVQSKFKSMTKYRTLEIGTIRRRSVSEETADVIWATLHVLREMLPLRVYKILEQAEDYIRKGQLTHISLKEHILKYEKNKYEEKE